MFWSGFMSMSPLSKSLWILVIVKLFIMYFILKPFFFPNVLDSTYKDDADKANHVRTELFEKHREQNKNDNQEKSNIWIN